MTLDHPALWGIDASLGELPGKKGYVIKCAIHKSKVAWSNVIAKRCEAPFFSAWLLWKASVVSYLREGA